MYSRQNVTGFDNTSLMHTSSFMTLKIITLCRIMSLVSNFDLLFNNAMEELYENFRSKHTEWSSYSWFLSKNWICVEAWFCLAVTNAFKSRFSEPFCVMATN